MTELKHTPGPWVLYDDSNDGKTNRMEICATGKTVARIYQSVPEEDLPNALLIVAAPDLLAALCVIVVDDAIEYDQGGMYTIAVNGRDLIQARAAIAKATPPAH